MQKSRGTLHYPSEGPRFGLPEGIGFYECQLNPETKSSPYRAADIVLAFHSASGLSVGKWLDRLLQFEPADGQSLFSTPRQPNWDSHYFRTRYAIPNLEIMRQLGEPTLMMFGPDGTATLAEAIYSGHSWRRGAESFVRKRRPGLNRRKASGDEIYEHARWRKRKTNQQEDIDMHYTEMPLVDRLAITLLCS